MAKNHPPMLPENNIAFEDAFGKQKPGQAGRCDFETIVENGDVPKNLVRNVRTIAQAAENEIQSKKLFLTALNDMIREDGGTTDVFSAFRDTSQHYISSNTKGTNPGMYGSQVVVSLRTFPSDSSASKTLGPRETSTKFGFRFRLPLLGETQDAIPRSISTSYYQIDSVPFELLAKLQVPNALKEQYLTGFVKMANMAEHDYLHQLVSLADPTADVHYPDKMYHLFPDLDVNGVVDLERHMLCMHAHICDRLFQEERSSVDAHGQPITLKIGAKRKEAVLTWAAQQFRTLGDMQDVALSHASTPEEKAEVKEAITYFAEIFGHRLFRVISPADLASFKQKLILNDPLKSKPPLETTVAEQADRLQFKIPQERGKPVLEEHTHGIKGLRRLCELFHGDLYVKSHATETISIVTNMVQIFGKKLALQTDPMAPHMAVDAGGGCVCAIRVTKNENGVGRTCTHSWSGRS